MILLWAIFSPKADRKAGKTPGENARPLFGLAEQAKTLKVENISVCVRKSALVAAELLNVLVVQSLEEHGVAISFFAVCGVGSLVHGRQ